MIIINIRFDFHVSEAIMNAAMAITEATSGLVKYAAAVQQENQEAGRFVY